MIINEEFLRADGAGEPWIELRQKALDRLAMFFQAHYAKSMAWGMPSARASLICALPTLTECPFPRAGDARKIQSVLGGNVVKRSEIIRPRWALEPGRGRLLRRQCGGI